MEENNDTWSLLAVVRESNRMAQNNAPQQPPPPSSDPLTLAQAQARVQAPEPEPRLEPIPYSFTLAAMNNNLGLDSGLIFGDHSFGSLFGYNNNNNNPSPFDELANLYRPFLTQSCAAAATAGGGVGGFGAGDGVNSGGVLNFGESHQNFYQQHQSMLIDAVGAGGGVAVGAVAVAAAGSGGGVGGGVQNRRPIGGPCPVGIHKKKRLEDRRVCRMRLDELSEDKWAWRKYGQKPIKGSPYPRNYYRCSTTKGCTARKQVERSPSDPNTYLVTYTGQHHHARPPLRGSGRITRQTTEPNPNPNNTNNNSNSPITGPPTPEPNGPGSRLNNGAREDDIEKIPNPMPGPEMLTAGMQRLIMNDVFHPHNNNNNNPPTEDKTVGNEFRFGSTSGYGYGYDPYAGYGYGYGYEAMMNEINMMGDDPNANGSWYLGVQQKEMMDSSSSASSSGGSGSGGAADVPTPPAAAHEPPAGRDSNIWDNGKPNFMF